MNIVRDNRCRGVCIVAVERKVGVVVHRTMRAVVATFPTTMAGPERRGVGWTKPRRYGNEIVDAPQPEQVSAVLAWIAAHGRPELDAAERASFTSAVVTPAADGFDASNRPQPVPDPKSIVVAAAMAARIPVEDVYGPCRWSEATIAREVAGAAMRGWLGHSYPKIARVIGRTSHSGIQHAVSRRWPSRDPEFRRQLVATFVSRLADRGFAQPDASNGAAQAAEGNQA